MAGADCTTETSVCPPARFIVQQLKSRWTGGGTTSRVFDLHVIVIAAFMKVPSPITCTAVHRNGSRGVASVAGRHSAAPKRLAGIEYATVA